MTDATTSGMLSTLPPDAQLHPEEPAVAAQSAPPPPPDGGNDSLAIMAQRRALAESAPPPPPDPLAALRSAVDQMRLGVHRDVTGRLHTLEQIVGHLAYQVMAQAPKSS